MLLRAQMRSRRAADDAVVRQLESSGWIVGQRSARLMQHVRGSSGGGGGSGVAKPPSYQKQLDKEDGGDFTVPSMSESFFGAAQVCGCCVSAGIVWRCARDSVLHHCLRCFYEHTDTIAAQLSA
jgi:hypothetical protein